jgi:hypothetical protein
MQVTEFYPYRAVENEPDRLHLRLHPNQAPLRFMLFRIVPLFLLALCCTAVAAYEDDMPWWYIPAVLIVLIPIYFLFKNKYFTRIYITKTQIKANQQGFLGTREKHIDLRDAMHVLLIKQNVIRGAQAHCYEEDNLGYKSYE